jgi:hypothetical protein
LCGQDGWHLSSWWWLHHRGFPTAFCVPLRSLGTKTLHTFSQNLWLSTSISVYMITVNLKLISYTVYRMWVSAYQESPLLHVVSHDSVTWFTKLLFNTYRYRETTWHVGDVTILGNW